MAGRESENERGRSGRGCLGLDQDVSMGIIFDKYVLQTHGLYRMTGDRTLSKAGKNKARL